MHPESDDIYLMAQIARQDDHALHTLYQQYGTAVYSLAYRVLQNTTLAEEATQDTFLKIWQQKTTWDPAKGALKSWLLTIAHHTAIDRLRREARQPATHPEAIEDVEAFGTLRPETWQDDILLRSLIQHIPAEQATLIELAFFGGLSHSEIAERTALPLGTIKTRLRSGLRKLRELWLETSNHH